MALRRQSKKFENFFSKCGFEFLGKVRIREIQQTFEVAPCKTRSGVLFAAWCHVLMSGHMGDRVVLMQILAKASQLQILGWRKHTAFQTLQLNADRVVIALGTSTVLGLPRMPGPVLGADKLDQSAITSDEKMGRHLQAPDLLEIRVGIPVQLVREKGLHLWAAILARRQADRMDHHQVDACPLWPDAKIGGIDPLCRGIPAIQPNRRGCSR